MSFLESEDLKRDVGNAVVKKAMEKALKTVHEIARHERQAAMEFAFSMCLNCAKATDSVEDLRAQLSSLLTASQEAAKAHESKNP
jgi:hypothetical protein